MKTLVLGGTTEARLLAEALGSEAVLSLAGVTAKPLPVRHRTGGFGGVEGLEAYLRAEKFQNVIDATHPFAAHISHNAFEAAKQIGLPLLRLERPAWPREPEWQVVDNLMEAAKAIPTGTRVFLSVGRQSLGAFLQRDDMWCLTRSIAPPNQAPFGEVILQRPPFLLQDELGLMVAHNITHLVSKNAGGEATRAKLEAAKQLGVKVIMVKRPRLPAVLTVETVAEAVKWVKKPRGMI
ncbi:MAG TPA: cobalt-precorrin-6A reductase [Rhodobacteraceae bacterium]|nr:cobalt-precorrin-6A reductase [Paracoccaceae bacterium]